MKTGKVWLVGAGPGDIGLFTLKGLKVCLLYTSIAKQKGRSSADVLFLMLFFPFCDKLKLFLVR